MLRNPEYYEMWIKRVYYITFTTAFIIIVYGLVSNLLF